MKPYKQPRQRYSNSVHQALDPVSGESRVFDSKLEKYHFLKSTWEGAKSYIHQPKHHQISYPWRSKLKVRHTPDAEVIDAESEIFVDEVKYDEETQKEDFKEQTEIRSAIYERRGYTYRVITELNVYNGENISNIAMLFPCLRHPAPFNEFEVLTKDLASINYTLREMNNIAISKGLEPIYVKRAIAHRLFSIDITQPPHNWKLNWDHSKVPQ